ncbi:hypothetical protein MNBD_DELTA01-1702 [hydrothermal vent metagenome]|uniref:Transglutaminase-like domain-containing protein n=1 Tax=hydrothermal vent metagenome TaxID=652676 RepID=A0A3B0QYR4_9ZZZZ
MKNRVFRSRAVKAFLVIIVSLATLFVAVGYAGEKLREVRLEYKFVIDALPASTAKVRVWVPLPSALPVQEVKGLKVKAPAPYTIGKEAVWGNSVIYFELDGDKARSAPVEFSMVFTVTRQELKGLGKEAGRLTAIKDGLVKYLRPSRMGPHSDLVKTLATKAASGETGVEDKARHIYDFVLKNMDYNKNKPGWGRGDVSRVCLAIAGGEKGTGNCTDFHSFFAALLQTQKIPVLFEMGYPLKPGSGGSVGGYHCWASFYTEEHGWVPVDISEADKAPKLVDYYFGSIDENRVTFSRGRDIVLVPRQEGEPLNYFGPDPYIEVDGKPFEGFERTISYKDIK